MSVAVYNHFEGLFSGIQTVYSEQVSNTGEVRQVVVVVPNITGTCTITVVDENGVQLFTSGALAANSKTVFWPYTTGMPFCVSAGGDNTCNVVMTLSQSNNGAAILVNMFIKA